MSAIGLFVGLFIATTALAEEAPVEPGQVIGYRCGDLVVLGRVNVLTYADIIDVNDLLGHGVFTADVDIKRVLKGTAKRRRVRASFVAHAQMRDDLDFLIVLSPKIGGDYQLSRAAMWDRSPRPLLASNCAAPSSPETASNAPP